MNKNRNRPDNNFININNSLIIQNNSGLNNSDKNEKSIINQSNFNSIKPKSANFAEIAMKLLNELKTKYKISEDPKAIKEFEAFYNNMSDKLNQLKNANGPPNANNTSILNNSTMPNNSSNTNPAQENSTINVKTFNFNIKFFK